ncbi:MAG: hypothetical protein AAFV53_16465 [Myxococcota bacterium]
MLASTRSDPIRYFQLPRSPHPVGDLIAYDLSGEVHHLDAEWAAVHEISADAARVLMSAATQDSLQKIGAAARQFIEAMRNVAIEQTGADPIEALSAARDEMKRPLQQLDEGTEAEGEGLQRSLVTHTNNLFTALSDIGREVAQAFDTDDGRAAIRALGEKMARYGEE